MRLDQASALRIGGEDVERVMHAGEQVWSDTLDPLTAMSPVVVGWASDPSWSISNGDPVTNANPWPNQGSSSSTFGQTTGANQPLWQAAGLGGKPAVVFDGVNDRLSGSVPTNAQPWSLVYIAAAAGGAAVRGAMGFGTNALMRLSATGEPTLFSTSALTDSTIGTTSHMSVGVGNGATSKLIVNNRSPVTGTTGPGTLATIGILGATNILGSNPWNGPIAFFAVYSGDVTLHADWPAFKAWVTDYYGIPT